MKTIVVFADVYSAEAYIDDELVATMQKTDTIETFNESLKKLYNVDKINVKTRNPHVIRDGEVIDSETGEIIGSSKAKKNFVFTIVDAHSANCVGRELNTEEQRRLRGMSLAYMGCSTTIGVAAGFVFGKTALTIAAIGLGVQLLTDVSTINLRKKLFRSRLDAFKRA